MRRSISAQSCESVPPGAGADGDDRVAGVVLAAEQPRLLELAPGAARPSRAATSSSAAISASSAASSASSSRSATSDSSDAEGLQPALGRGVLRRRCGRPSPGRPRSRDAASPPRAALSRTRAGGVKGSPRAASGPRGPPRAARTRSLVETASATAHDLRGASDRCAGVSASTVSRTAHRSRWSLTSAARLHQRVRGRRPDEAKPAPLQLAGKRLRLSGRGWDVAERARGAGDRRPARTTRSARPETRRRHGARARRGRWRSPPRSWPGCERSRRRRAGASRHRARSGDAVDLEPREGAPEGLALAKDRDPGEAGLEGLEA